MNEIARGREGNHAVCHVKKERRELVALVFGLRDRVLQNLCHVVEVPRQDADLVLPFYFNALRKIARRNLPRAERERADGRNQNLGEEEG